MQSPSNFRQYPSPYNPYAGRVRRIEDAPINNGSHAHYGSDSFGNLAVEVTNSNINTTRAKLFGLAGFAALATGIASACSDSKESQMSAPLLISSIPLLSGSLWYGVKSYIQTRQIYNNI